MCMLSCVQHFATPWTAAHQAPLPMEFSMQEYWNGLPFPSPGDLPDPRMESTSPALAGRLFITESPAKPTSVLRNIFFTQTNIMIYIHFGFFMITLCSFIILNHSHPLFEGLGRKF